MADEKKPVKLTVVQGGARYPSSASVDRAKSLGLPVVPIRVEEMFMDVPAVSPQTPKP